MYGLKHTAIIAYLQLIKQMDGHGYYIIPYTIFLWKYCNLATKFCLCVDGFGVKYF